MDFLSVSRITQSNWLNMYNSAQLAITVFALEGPQKFLSLLSQNHAKKTHNTLKVRLSKRIKFYLF